MIRSRFLSVALALGLGLVSGCLCLRTHPLFQKRAAECECPPGAAAPSEGPVLDGGTMALPPVMTPESTITVPPLAPAPRLVPQPQAQPAPYVPR